jgi:hypothetical protein
VDFIAELGQRRIALEVKSSYEVLADAVTPLRILKKEYENSIETFLVYAGKKQKKINGIWCLPWQEFLRELGL